MSTMVKIKVIVTFSFFFVFGCLVGYFIENKFARKIVHVDLDATNIEMYDENTRYPFMPKQYSDYICNLAKELRIDSDIAVSILMVENPEFNPDATNRNKNGTNDLGLWQMNDMYVYSVFVKSYWDIDTDFNPYNWKHSTFLAMHHIEFLLRSLKVQDDAIMAYNCGRGRVIDNDIPAITRQYLAKVNNNLKLLKNTKEIEK